MECYEKYKDDFTWDEWCQIRNGLRILKDNSWSVKVSSRIAELLGESVLWDSGVGSRDSVEYTWNHGYETLIVKRDGEGSSEYRGTYHPNQGFCEPEPFYEGNDLNKSFICHHCGATIW